MEFVSKYAKVRCTPGSPIFSLPPAEFMNWPGKKNLRSEK